MPYKREGFVQCVRKLNFNQIVRNAYAYIKISPELKENFLFQKKAVSICLHFIYVIQ